jgi:kynurenine formamidase
VAGFDFFQELAAKRDRVVPEDYVMHKIMLGRGVLLVEHLATLSGLAALPGRQRGSTGPASAWITDSLA